MNIVIVGDGKVGYTLADCLSKDGHDVTIVDNNKKALAKASETLDVLCVPGSGANVRTLLEAGVETADVVIAATTGDETNMVCAMMAKQLGATDCINPKDYSDPIQQVIIDLTDGGFGPGWHPEEFLTFNAFFARQRNYDAYFADLKKAGLLASFDEAERELPAVADARLSVYPVTPDLEAPVKQSVYTLSELVGRNGHYALTLADLGDRAEERVCAFGCRQLSARRREVLALGRARRHYVHNAEPANRLDGRLAVGAYAEEGDVFHRDDHRPRNPDTSASVLALAVLARVTAAVWASPRAMLITRMFSRVCGILTFSNRLTRWEVMRSSSARRSRWRARTARSTSRRVRERTASIASSYQGGVA